MVGASIVVHKTPKEQLKKSLECLCRSNIDKIYIIDNSPDDILKEIAESFNKTEYFHIKNNGFGAGHNIAIRKSIENGMDYHLVMNADVYWEGNIMEPIIKFMDSNPGVGLLSPKTYYPNGELQYTCRRLPSVKDMILNAFIPENLNKKRSSNYLLKKHDHNKVLNCPYLLGSFMFFRLKTLKEVGLFDERFFMYPEDIDITRRIHEKWETLYWPEVSIIHEHQQASKKNLKMFLIHLNNMIKYFNKWGWIIDKKRKIFNEPLKEG